MYETDPPVDEEIQIAVNFVDNVNELTYRNIYNIANDMAVLKTVFGSSSKFKLRNFTPFNLNFFVSYSPRSQW